MDPLEVLRKKLRDRLNDLADVVAGGGASDWAEYRHIVGQITGLAVAERDLLDLMEKMNDE